MRATKLGIFAVAVLVGLASVAASKIKPTTEEAFVTLLYGDEFLLGVRVLGKSIRDTGSTKDMVVLVSDGVSRYAIDQLKADGWIVDMISLLKNPNHNRPKRFWGVYTKLKIFNMTEYKKVVYLDADTIVVKNIDNLFKCNKFCANLKHSERLNSGVMVVEPSQKLFDDMMSKVTTLPSYTGGDQGFLNSYYSDFPNAHVFQPNNLRSSENSSKMERLSTLYNADVGLYMLANKWMVDESELRVIHYTLGPLKPWDWWTSWIVKPVDIWQVRFKLDATLPGTGGGTNPKDALIVKFLFIFPFLCILFLYYRTNPQQFRIPISDQGRLLLTKIQSLFLYTYSPVPSATSSPHALHSNVMAKCPTSLGAISVIMCLVCALLALAISFLIIPRQVTPWAGLLLMYEWTFALFSLFFGAFLHFVYSRGKLASLALPDYDDEKGHQKYSDATWRYWIGMGCLAVSVPCLPYVLGITALFAKMGLMVFGGLILASFMAYASDHLAISYFLKGYLDDSKRSRNSFFLC